jgi:Flagellar protein FliT
VTEVVTAESPLDEVLALSAAMLESARAQDWVAVANLEAARASLLRAAFEDRSLHAPEQLARAAQQILDSDREVIGLGERARGALAGELTQLRHGRRAHQAYSETGD